MEENTQLNSGTKKKRQIIIIKSTKRAILNTMVLT